MVIDIENKTILITGAAGFIGFHLIKELLDTYSHLLIIAFDNMNSYYDVSLKQKRLAILRDYISTNSLKFIKGDLSDKKNIDAIFEKYKPDIVVNLAAQAGVRYSITHPDTYIESNVAGFFNILEACRHSKDIGNSSVKHLVYASSSSVYGLNQKTPYCVDDKVDTPVSLYAATKKANELMAHSYSKLYDLPVTGLRFFTVYGPFGRPDMAYFSFTNKMVQGKKIQLYNYGDMYRDFTYIDDIVSGVMSVIKSPPRPNENNVKYKIYNIGNHRPVSLKFFVDTLEKVLLEQQIIRCPVEKELLPMQPGDVYQTYADISELKHAFNFAPHTSLEEGLRRYAKWYKNFYLEST